MATGTYPSSLVLAVIPSYSKRFKTAVCTSLQSTTQNILQCALEGHANRVIEMQSNANYHNEMPPPPCNIVIPR